MHFDSFETKHISVQVFEQKKVVCSLSFQSSQTIEFSLNVFAEFAEFSDQKYYIIKRLSKQSTCCVRYKDATRVLARQR